MKHLIPIAVLTVLMAACGGGETASDTGPDEPTVTTTTAGGSATTTTTTTAGSGDDGDSSAPETPSVSGIGEGTMTINGETYSFGDAGFPALQCEPDFFGVFMVFLEQVGGPGAGGSLQLTLLLEGTDPEVVGQNNEGRLQIGDQEWIAEPEDIAERGLEAGTSQIDSYTVNGNTASGTATFYEEESYFATTGGSSDPVLTAQGTFEVTCSGE